MKEIIPIYIDGISYAHVGILLGVREKSLEGTPIWVNINVT